MLGKKLKELTVTMVPKEKKPEPPKEKPVEPKIETPKAARDAKATWLRPPRRKPPPLRPAASDAPAVAPAAIKSAGLRVQRRRARKSKAFQTPNGIYKALVEHTLRSRWEPPGGHADDNYVAEVELSVDPTGNVDGSRWLNGSGDKRWDDSVKAAVAQTKAISRPPPKGFPEKFMVRFDVRELRRPKPSSQISSR